MRAICVTEMLMGACVIIVSTIRYFRILIDYRILTDEKRIFTKAMHRFCMLMMVFFIGAYLFMGAFYLFFQRELLPYNLVVTTIFLFGAYFVFLITTVQSDIYRKLDVKTEEIVKALVNAIEAKDRYTHGHSEHVCRLAELLYDHLPEQEQKKMNRRALLDAAILHDIGKIGIPDSILNKPGLLTEKEMDIIRQHPRLGKYILENTSFRNLGHMIMYHHERIDEKGYYQITADQISTESRIIAIADTFSALYTDRCYRPRKSYDDAVAILKGEAGAQFDEHLVNVFCQIPREKIDKASEHLFLVEGAAQPAMVNG